MQHHPQGDWGKNVTVYVLIYDEKPDMSAHSHCQACRHILLTLRKHRFTSTGRKRSSLSTWKIRAAISLVGISRTGRILIAKPKVAAFVAPSQQELDEDLGTYNWLTEHLTWTASITAPLHELYNSNKGELGMPKGARKCVQADEGIRWRLGSFLDLSSQVIGNLKKRILSHRIQVYLEGIFVKGNR